MAKDNHDGEAGFTLLETVVVLAIAAAVFAIGATGVSFLKGRTTPDHIAARIADIMNAARIDAQNGRSERVVTIDLDAKTVTGPRDVVAIPADYTLSVVAGRETVADNTVIDVYFLPDGTSSGAEVGISSPRGDKVRVDVNWLTGLPRVSDARP